MRKHFLFGAFALVGVGFYFNWTAISTIASIWLEPAPTISSTEYRTDVELIAGNAEEGQIELLERLAAGNRLFRWSVDFENSNTTCEIFASPQREQFRPRFDASASSQTWDNYYGWVDVFYKGNFVSQGWVKTAKEIVEAGGKTESIRYVNVLGRVLAAEWSKANAVRKINNTDMYRWGRDLKSGNVTLKEIARQAYNKLNGN